MREKSQGRDLPLDDGPDLDLLVDPFGLPRGFFMVAGRGSCEGTNFLFLYALFFTGIAGPEPVADVDDEAGFD